MRAFVLIVPVSISAFILAGCDSSSEPAPLPQTRVVPQPPNTNDPGTAPELESLRLALEAEDSLKKLFEDRIRAIPENKKRFNILLVEPDPNVNDTTLRLKLDPNTKYSIHVVDPDSGENDPELTRYFEDLLTAPNTRPDR